MTMEQASVIAERAVLAPQDGSDMGQFAAPYVVACARALDAPVVVTRVIEGGAWRGGDSGYLLAPKAYKQAATAVLKAARDETQRMCEFLDAAGVRSRPIVREGQGRQTLLEIEAEERVMLTVMATHARTGLARLALGSVADVLVRASACPTLLVRAVGPLVERPAMARAIVPLDGSPESERAFDTVDLLAGSLIERITLLRVIDPDEPAGASKIAAQYLDGVQARALARFGGRGVTCEATVHWGAPAAQILRAAQSQQSQQSHDLIVMTTHGASGAVRWALGSVADEVIHSALCPVLIARAVA